VFKYNYETKKIELKAHSLQGVTIRDFDNATSPAAIARQAAAL
jgi:pterin-4a-carbinolamine dehydratase